MPKDGLMRLPDGIVAPLLRALMQIRHSPHSRLLLQPPGQPRAPVWDARKSDYDVTWRGETVGRIWRHTYEGEPHEGFPWHWRIREPRRKEESGHALTLHEAMEQFRAAWDRLAPDVDTG